MSCTLQETTEQQKQSTVKMGEGPKLYVNKPKKAQMKQFKGVEAQSSKPPPPSSAVPSSSAIASYYSTGSSSSNGGGSNPGPEIPKPKESFVRRYKFVWPLLLTVNLAIGAYLFMRTKKKGPAEDEIAYVPPPAPVASPSAATCAISENLPVAQPVRVLDPIPVEQQQELFKWMLEEKRKIKTRDPQEKKRIEEEKAILKQFIRSNSIPGS